MPPPSSPVLVSDVSFSTDKAYANHGPFVVGTDIYVVGVGASSSAIVKKSADEGNNWTTAYQTATGIADATSSLLANGNIYILTILGHLGAETDTVTYQIFEFDPSTDTGASYTSAVTTELTHTLWDFSGFWVFGNGNVALFYNDFQAIMGSDYDKPYLSLWSGGSWTTSMVRSDLFDGAEHLVRINGSGGVGGSVDTAYISFTSSEEGSTPPDRVTKVASDGSLTPSTGVLTDIPIQHQLGPHPRTRLDPIVHNSAMYVYTLNHQDPFFGSGTWSQEIPFANIDTNDTYVLGNNPEAGSSHFSFDGDIYVAFVNFSDEVIVENRETGVETVAVALAYDPDQIQAAVVDSNGFGVIYGNYGGSVTYAYTSLVAAATTSVFSGAGVGVGLFSGRESLVFGTFTGTGAGTGTLSGIEIVTGSFAGTGVGTGSHAGTEVTFGAFGGSGAGTGSVVGQVTAFGTFSGTSAGTGTHTGSVTATGTFSGAGSGTGSVAGGEPTETLVGAFSGAGQGSGTHTGLTIEFGTHVGDALGDGALTGVSLDPPGLTVTINGGVATLDWDASLVGV